jgi:hypothetical protein
MSTHCFKHVMTIIVLSALASCGTSEHPSPPALKTVAPFDSNFGTSVLQFCEKNYGVRISKVVTTDGYVDLRSYVGCGRDCLRDFLKTGVNFVEVEIREGREGGASQSGPWESSYKYFPSSSGKYKYYEAYTGDPACAAFESIADKQYRNWIGLPDGRCIATQKMTSFSAEYEVENIFTKDKLIFEKVQPVKYTMSSAVVRHRKSGAITAENTGVNFSIAAAEKDNSSNHSGDVQLTCLKDFPASFLKKAIDPLL